MLIKLIERYRPIAAAAAVLPVAVAMAVLPFPVGAAGQESVDRLVEMARDAQSRAESATRADARSSKTVASRNGKVTLTISGHVNRALMLMGDGDQTDLLPVGPAVGPVETHLEYKRLYGAATKKVERFIVEQGQNSRA